MSQERTVRIAQQLLTKIGTGAEPDEIAALFSTDAQFEVPGDVGALPWIGRSTGRGAVSDFIRGTRSLLTRVRFDVKGILANDDGGHLRRPRFQGQRDWKDYRVTFCANPACLRRQDRPLPDVRGQLCSCYGCKTVNRRIALDGFV